MKTFLHSIFVLLVSAIGSAVYAASAEVGTVFFESRIRPILIEHCYECHSEEKGKRKGDLLLDRSSGWLRGGETGPAVVPGNIEKSLLATAVKHHDKDFQMPPEEPISEDKVVLLLRWIEMGAPGPSKELQESAFSKLGDQEYLSKKAEKHWAFQPISKSGELDDLVEKGLKREGMHFSPPADRRSQLRRLYYDLTGLPPSFEDVEAFVASKNPGAYRKIVDKLLASPQFGERWGRYWLDVARYADTREWQAAGLDSRYPFAYTYRDYVIQAFNEDKPYDQFIREQIAADFYTDKKDDTSLAALGFLTVGSRFRNNRQEIYNDRIDVVTRGVMGLTVVCARCHDHKFDAVPTTDYYALYGVFASCQDTDEYPVIHTGRPVSESDRLSYEAEYAKVVGVKQDYMDKLGGDARADFRSRPADYMGALYDSAITKKYSVRKLITGNKYSECVLTPLGARIVGLTNKRYVNDSVFRPWHALMNTSGPKFEAMLKDFIREERKIRRKVKTLPRVLDGLERRPVITNKRQFAVRYGEILAEAIRDPDGEGADLILAQIEKSDGAFWISSQAATSASRLLGKGRTTLAKYDNAINDVNAVHPGAPARAMVVKEAPRPYQPVVFERGEASRRGASVDRRFLTLFGGLKFEEGSGRKGLAESVASSDNPLTARVHVNRVWMHLFGESLVESPGDFGLQTPAPEQLKVLDSLAAEFIANQWSTKKLIRSIVQSRTYRQASKPVAAYQERDPANKYYWRQNVRRLDFEAMRDSMLAASGKLDLTSGGRAVDITAPPYSGRRTVYAYVDRVNFDDMFATFDVPSPDQSAPERPETMVPQQALFSMNDPFAIHQAKAIAAHPAMHAPGVKGSDRVAWMYRQIFQRDPKPFEVAAGIGFLSSAVQSLKQEAPTRDWQYGFAAYNREQGSVEGFTRFPFFDAAKKSYQFSKVFPHPKRRHLRLTAVGGHPGRPGEAVVLRWTAPYAGKFAIDGELLHNRENGDGILARIISSRHGELGQYIVHNKRVPTVVESVFVEPGETIDFVVNCRETTTSDSYNWRPVIRRLGMAETVPLGIKTVWVSQADFAGPPPPPLRPPAQLAHALLMTNEFLFLD